MADDLEVRRYVLELLGDILADLAQPAAADGAPARLAGGVVMRGAGLGPQHLLLAWQMRREAAIDLGSVGRASAGRRPHRVGRSRVASPARGSSHM